MYIKKLPIIFVNLMKPLVGLLSGLDNNTVKPFNNWPTAIDVS